jgi:alpha-beta hydrolase superfamily lysophospholipase
MRLLIPESRAPLTSERVAVTDPFEEWILPGVYGDRLPVRVGRTTGPVAAVILAAHGVTGSRMAPYISGASKQWTRSGFAVVAPDFPFHGGRFDPEVGYGPAQEPATIRQALGDLRHTVGFIREEISDAPIVLVGFSMGALFGTIFTSQEARVAALCIVVAGSNARRVRFGNPSLPAEALEMIEAADPATYAGGVSPRPVLMLCADRDELFDRVAAFDLFDAFTAPKELSFFPGTHAEWPHPGPVYRRISAFVAEQAAGNTPDA